jgi:DNA-binding NarL/FixJ family response regulator
MSRLLIADDHSIVRKGIIVLCKTQFGLSEVEEASDCSQVMSALKRNKCTHLILDLVLSDGVTLEIMPNIRRLYPDLKILIFTMQPYEIYAAVLERYGVMEFIPKDAPEKETIRMLRNFLFGIEARQGGGRLGEDNPFAGFTPREMEVLHYMLMGIGSVEIGNRLNMKSNTVSTFKRRIFEKSNTKNVIELKDLIERSFRSASCKPFPGAG